MTLVEAIDIVNNMRFNLIKDASYFRDEAMDDTGEYYECMQAASNCQRKAQALGIILDELNKKAL